MSGSHFIKDEDGNYHEMNDQEYGEMQREKAVTAGGSLIFAGIVFVLLGKYLEIGTIWYLMGGGAALIGAIIAWANTSVGDFFVVLLTDAILLAGVYFGAKWIFNSSEDEDNKSKDKTEQVVRSSVSSQINDESIAFNQVQV